MIIVTTTNAKKLGEGVDSGNEDMTNLERTSYYFRQAMTVRYIPSSLDLIKFNYIK